MKSKLFKNLPVIVPSIPNFIRVANQTYPISDFTEEELQDIGEEWTRQFIIKAKKKQGKHLYS